MKGQAPHKLNFLPADSRQFLAARLACRYATGEDSLIDEAEWAILFSDAIGARRNILQSGLDHIVLEYTAWCCKVVHEDEFSPCFENAIRYGTLICSRLNPRDYSNVEMASDGVVSTWNDKIKLAKDSCRDIRLAAMKMFADRPSYIIYEKSIDYLNKNDYDWSLEDKANLVGKLKGREDKKIQWNMDNSQFMMFEDIPDSATCIDVKNHPASPSKTTRTYSALNATIILENA